MDKKSTNIQRKCVCVCVYLSQNSMVNAHTQPAFQVIHTAMNFTEKNMHDFHTIKSVEIEQD